MTSEDLKRSEDLNFGTSDIRIKRVALPIDLVRAGQKLVIRKQQESVMGKGSSEPSRAAN
ncbi:MAG: hypothetical protein DWQ31_04640 [Planctomycetota bacterium]|nr:MAG: hypothetical protein DWQ31_04640 [Planctomycetota bacterium]REJ97119.1 MAG: hypothetical protein DWQ35_02565 [Planctomycetota bacterium]REK22503.1 MAG: hypothetical protein DWQ42_17080 [Planctomycetota bacterium]REK47145.1 MAG: hypothetical protein DWQ46_05065 [Planctomycetota bacterium]